MLLTVCDSKNKLSRLPVRLVLDEGIGLRTWFRMFEARLLCGGKDNKSHNIQLVLTLGLTTTEVWLGLDRNDNLLKFNPF